MVREQVGVIFHWLQDRISSNKKVRKYQAKQQERCGCNNIISSSTTNLKQLESFFCQFWPELCENSLLCDRNNNSLSSHPPEEEEQNSNSLSSSSLMLILPENRPDSHSRAKLCRTVTPLKSPGLVLSLMRRGFDANSGEGRSCEDDLYLDMSSLSRRRKGSKAVSLPRRRYSRLNPSCTRTRLVRKISNYDQKFYKIEPAQPRCQSNQCDLQVTVNGKHVCGDLILKNL